MKRFAKVVDHEQLRFSLLYYLEKVPVVETVLPRGEEGLVCCGRVILLKATLTEG